MLNVSDSNAKSEYLFNDYWNILIKNMCCFTRESFFGLTSKFKDQFQNFSNNK